MDIVGRYTGSPLNRSRSVIFFKKIYLSFPALYAVVGVLGWLLYGERTVIDYIQYWAGAKLFAAGANPYDAAQIGAIEHQVWGSRAFPILLWNTPCIFPLIIPLALFDYHAGRLFWLTLQAGAVLASLWCMRRLMHTQGRELPLRGRTGVALLFCLITFYPALLSLHDGQVSPLLLLGLCGYLYARYRPEPRPFIAGLFLSVTLLKPHLLYLVYLQLLYSAVHAREMRVLGGLLTGALVLSVAPRLYHPGIWRLYAAAMSHPPLYWQTPTLGSYFQWALGGNSELVRAFPSLVVAVAVAARMLRTGRAVDEKSLYLLIPLSLLSAPYGWVFDQLLLLPTLVCLSLGPRALWYLSSVAVLNIAMMCSPGSFGQQYFIWYTAAFLLLAWMSKVDSPRRQKGV